MDQDTEIHLIEDTRYERYKSIVMKIDNERYRRYAEKNKPLKFPYDFRHEPREMDIVIGCNHKAMDAEFYLSINGVSFDDLPEAPQIERAQLARSKTTINMNGSKKYGSFPILRNGELIPVSVQLN